MYDLFLNLSVLQMPVTNGQTNEVTLNFLDLAFKGGWIMIPILFLSIIAVYIFVERYFAIRTATKHDANFMQQIRNYIIEDKTASAIELCKNNDTPVSRMIMKGIQRIGRPLNDVNAAIENVGNLEISCRSSTHDWFFGYGYGNDSGFLRYVECGK